MDRISDFKCIHKRLCGHDSGVDAAQLSDDLNTRQVKREKEADKLPTRHKHEVNGAQQLASLCSQSSDCLDVPTKTKEDEAFMTIVKSGIWTDS